MTTDTTRERTTRRRGTSVLAALAMGAGAALLIGAAAPQMRRLAGAAGEAVAATGAPAVTAAAAIDGEPAESAGDPLLAAYLAERFAPAEAYAGIPDPVRRERLANELSTFYERRGHALAWSTRGRLDHAARELTQALAGAAARGLDPAEYGTDRLAAAVDEAGRRRQVPARLMALDTALTAAFLAHAADLAEGRVGPRGAGGLWRIEPAPVDLAAALEGALAEGAGPDGGVAAALDHLAPHPEVAALAAALERYRAIAEAGGWPAVPAGETLEPGMAAEPARLAALARRLSIEGDLSARAEAALRERWRQARSTGTEARYEPLLAAAVERFQDRHGLAVDGKVGGETLDALNVPAAERAARLALNLERWRWLPADLGERHLRVNVAGFRLAAYDRGEEVLTMPVVVGRKSWPTPIFTESMTRVEMNPFWHVPRSIARAEIVPDARRDPDYLAKKGYELVDRETGERVDPAAVDLAAIGDGVRVRQRPGRGNALGQIKFLFPNRFNVYLHDTPQQSGFARHRRALSHGCVRVERPLDLAEFVFAGETGWTPEEVRAEIANGRPKRVELERPIPVWILYWTAFVDAGGRVHFRDDVYGHDRPLATALAGVRGDRLAALLAPGAEPAEPPAEAQAAGTRVAAVSPAALEAAALEAAALETAQNGAASAR